MGTNGREIAGVELPRIAFIGDIHGNLPALEAVLAAIAGLGIDEIWCHGDISYGGPWPRECAALVRSACRVVTRGNTDDVIADIDNPDEVGLRDRLAMGDELTTWLRGQPAEYVHSVMLTHATRRSNRARLPDSDAPDALWIDEFGPAPATVVCGHSHMAFDRRIGDDLRVVNTGSVGAPFDGDPRASYVVGAHESGVWRFTHGRAEYDREATAKVLETLPHAEGRRWAQAIRHGRP